MGQICGFSVQQLFGSTLLTRQSEILAGLSVVRRYSRVPGSTPDVVLEHLEGVISHSSKPSFSTLLHVVPLTRLATSIYTVRDPDGDTSMAS